jgi:hypothetical protein
VWDGDLLRLGAARNAHPPVAGPLAGKHLATSANVGPSPFRIEVTHLFPDSDHEKHGDLREIVPPQHITA